MATIEEKEPPQPSVIVRTVERLTAPVTERNGRIVALLAVAAAAATFAPLPVGAVAAAALVVAAAEVRRR